MSGIIAIFNRDRSPVDAAQLDKMLVAIDHRGHDGCDVVRHPFVALGHQHFWTTSEETGERQPLTDEAARYHLVLDGRLDNRSELLSALGRHHPVSRAPSDGQLVLLAYERWGESCFERLVGAFALVLFDALRGRIVCARDPLGNRTLFYHLDDRRLVVASEESAVVAHAAVSDELNPRRLAWHCAGMAPEDGTTFFAQVSELLPAHALVVDEARWRTWRFWRPDPEARLRYRSDAEYAEHFRCLLRQSVRCRLRTASPPAVLMSGGLDSTSVAALAALELEERGDAQPLATISWVFYQLSSCDERFYIEQMQRLWGTAARFVPGDDAWPLQQAAAWPTNPNTPEDNPYRRLKQRAYRAAREGGARVLLTGGFGDHLYAGAAYWLGDLLAEGRLVEAGRELLADIRRKGLRRCRSRVALVHALGLAARRRAAAPWLRPEARHAVLAHAAPPWPYPENRRRLYESLLGARASRSATIEILHANREGVELRHPFRDQRIVEFVLSIPMHQVYRRGAYKQVLRNAMRGFLPEAIRRREDTTSLAPLYRRGLAERQAEAVAGLLSSAEAGCRRWVAPDWLAAAEPGRMRSGREEIALWNCLSFELWRRARASSQRGEETRMIA